MEVHHPHHPTHKKKWSEYLIEFLMLFAAVTPPLRLVISIRLLVYYQNITGHQRILKYFIE